MNVSATLNDEIVNIVNVNGDGNTAYVTYIDSGGELRLVKQSWSVGGGSDISLYIASGASVV